MSRMRPLDYRPGWPGCPKSVARTGRGRRANHPGFLDLWRRANRPPLRRVRTLLPFRHMSAHLSAPVLGCGLCVDMPLTDWLPFVVYWLGLLLVWSLIAGPICHAIARRQAPLAALHPTWYFVGSFVVLIVGAMLLMGAVFTPLLLILAFWIAAIIQGIRQQNSIWRRANLVLMALLLCAVPISYARPRVFDGYRAKIQALKNHPPE